MAKKTERWFQPGKSLGWEKDMSQTQRRKVALASRKGNLLSTARALQSLSNVTKDAETARKARADAKYFYDQYRRKKEK